MVRAAARSRGHRLQSAVRLAAERFAERFGAQTCNGAAVAQARSVSYHLLHDGLGISPADRSLATTAYRRNRSSHSAEGRTGSSRSTACGRGGEAPVRFRAGALGADRIGSNRPTRSGDRAESPSYRRRPVVVRYSGAGLRGVLQRAVSEPPGSRSTACRAICRLCRVATGLFERCRPGRSGGVLDFNVERPPSPPSSDGLPEARGPNVQGLLLLSRISRRPPAPTARLQHPMPCHQLHDVAGLLPAVVEPLFRPGGSRGGISHRQPYPCICGEPRRHVRQHARAPRGLDR